MTSLSLKNSPPTLKSPPRVAIVGARGYSGLELTRLCWQHPAMDLAFVSAQSSFRLSDYLNDQAAKPLPPVINAPDFSQAQLDVVFLATPHETSWELTPTLVEQGIQVIDLSGGFRLKDSFTQSNRQAYAQWYGQEPSPLTMEMANSAHYGLVPFNQSSISMVSANSQPRVIANPGCYATSILMALIPLLREGLIDPHYIVIDAKSGTTGAGRKSQEGLLFSEVAEECVPYKIGVHQHQPEIVQALNQFAQSANGVDLTMNTHLLNVRRGIISSLYLRPSAASSDSEILQSLHQAYTKHFHHYPLVRWGSVDSHPRLLRLKSVVGTPFTHISFQVVKGKIFLFSLLDNLLKGAASQALENFNRLYDLPVNLGLDHLEALS